MSSFVPLGVASSSRLSPAKAAAPVANGVAGPSTHARPTAAQERAARELAANTARDQDNDDFFTKRRKARPPPIVTSGDEEEEEGSDGDGSGGNTSDSSRGSDGKRGRGRPKKHHRKQSGPSLPSWAKTDSSKWKRSHVSEDEQEEEEEDEGFSFSQGITFTGGNKKRKAKAQAARQTKSPSLTPPPETDKLGEYEVHVCGPGEVLTLASHPHSHRTGTSYRRATHGAREPASSCVR